MKIEDIRRVGSMDGAVRWVASQAAAHGWKPVSLPSGTPETETRFRRLERDAFLTPDEQLAVFVYTELPGENTVTITRSRFDLKKLKRGMKGGIPQSIPEPKPISVPDALRGVVLGKPLFSLGGTKAEDPLTLVSEVVGDRRTLTKNLAEVFRANGWTLENWTEEKPVRDALDGKALVSATRADAWCQVMVGGHEGRTFATYRLAFSGDALRPGRAY